MKTILYEGLPLAHTTYIPLVKSIQVTVTVIHEICDLSRANIESKISIKPRLSQ